MDMPEEKSDYRDPVTEIQEIEDGVKLIVELPGVAQDSVKMAVSKDVVTIEAEGRRGDFRTIQVMPFKPDPDRVSVSFSQGVLEILLPKMGSKPKKEGSRDRSSKEPESVEIDEDPVESFKEEMEKLNNDLIRVTEEKASLEERVTYLRRDFQNLRRRHETEKEKLVKNKIQEIGLDLVEVLDNFERARHSIENTKASDRTKKNILTGLNMVKIQVDNLFSRIGIVRMRSVGECFDPRYHEVVGKRTDPDKEDEVILEEHSPGYLFEDEVLRPAMVVINKNESSERGCRSNEDDSVEGSEKKSKTE